MAEQKISLSNIINEKTVNIEGFGVFRVRKLGAGEELDLSDRLRRLNQIITELENINFEKFEGNKKPTKAQRKELLEIQNRSNSLLDEISEIKKFELKTYKRCFRDDSEGEKVEQLLNSLSETERSALFKQIFDEPKIVEATDTPSMDVDEEVNENAS